VGKKRQQSLIVAIASFIWGTSLKAVLSLLLSSALIASAGYFLFNAQAEEDELEEQLDKFINEDSEYSLGTQIGQIYTTGWFSDKDNMQRLNGITSILVNNGPNSPLDTSFRDSSLEWCFGALQRLTFEQGKIEGFILQDTVLLSLQQNIIHAYEFTIALTDKTLHLLRDWSEISRDEKNTFFDQIVSLSLDFQENAAQYEPLVSQLASQVEVRKREVALESKRLRNKNNVFVNRQLVAGGIIFLVVMLLIVSGSLYVLQVLHSRIPKKQLTTKKMGAHNNSRRKR
jgi:hypothetical protein